ITYSILERWIEVKTINPTIEYPEEAIRNQDWPIVSESLRGGGEESSTMINTSLQEYITNNTIHESATVEQLVERNKQGY
ncbi:hypothetical protein ACE106_22790, partial [Shouchella clausii]